VDHEDGHQELKHQETNHEEVMARCQKRAQVKQKEKDQTLNLKSTKAKSESPRSKTPAWTYDLPHAKDRQYYFANPLQLVEDSSMTRPNLLSRKHEQNLPDEKSAPFFMPPFIYIDPDADEIETISSEDIYDVRSQSEK
jgi:hypothetical protein